MSIQTQDCSTVTGQFYQEFIIYMHCTLMPHKSYYGDIYRLGLGSYWYVKTINITLTCAKLSKPWPVGPRVSLSNSYSWCRMNHSSFVQWSWVVDIHLDLRVKNLLNFKPCFHHHTPQRIVSLQTGCQQWRFATARDFFKCASLYITRLIYEPLLDYNRNHTLASLWLY